MNAHVRPPTARRTAADMRPLAEALRDIIAEGFAPPGVALPPGTHGAAAELARRTNVPRQTMKERLRCMTDLGLADVWAEAAKAWHGKGAPPAAASAQPELPAERGEMQRLRDRATRLETDLRNALRFGSDEDAVLALIGRMGKAAEAPPAWLTKPPKKKPSAPTPEVPVTIWSDWHYGEVVQPGEVNGINAYDTAVARRRVDRLINDTISLASRNHTGIYPGIIINLLGDFISGGLHPELLRTDEEGRIPAALAVRDILVGALTRMADHFGQVFCPCTPGNHGRNTQKPEFKEYHKGNFDWLVYQLLARHFEAKGDGRVKFLIPSSGEAYYRVYGLRIMALHGDMLGVKGGDGIIGAIGPIMRGTIKTQGQASAIERPFDMLLMGHWHQMLWLPKAVVAGSLKGFDEYAKNALRAVPAPPSQPLFFVHPRRGITARWEVVLEDGPPQGNSQWLTFQEAR